MRRDSDRVAPYRTGSLEDVPFAELLAWFARKTPSGTLVLLPTANQPEMRLLISSGTLIAFDPAPTGPSERIRGLFGEQREFSFYADIDLTSEHTRATSNLDPVRILALGLRVAARDDLATGHWLSIKQSRVQFRPNELTDRLALDDGWKRLLLGFDKPRLISANEAALGVWGIPRVARLFYVLRLLGAIVVDDADRPLERARELMGMHDHDGALGTIYAALSYTADDPNLLALLAEVLLRRNSDGDVADALRAIDRALLHAPAHAHAHYIKALILLQQNEPSRADHHARHAALLDRNHEAANAWIRRESVIAGLRRALGLG